jgi:hypothetical protein
MDHVEEPPEELVEDEREETDAYDEDDRQHGCRDPLFARRPGHSPEFRDDPADEVASRKRLGRSLLLFVHQRFTSKSWQGGQDSNLQQLVLETRTLPIELPPYRVSLCGLWQRQKRQYLLSSSRSVVFDLFFCVL